MGQQRKENNIVRLQGRFVMGEENIKLVNYLLKVMLQLCLCRQSNICMSV